MCVYIYHIIYNINTYFLYAYRVILISLREIALNKRVKVIYECDWERVVYLCQRNIIVFKIKAKNKRDP